MASTNGHPEQALAIKNGAAYPLHITVKYRNRWALEALIAAGSKGCAPIHNPAPIWSAYVHKLRKARVGLETLIENHGGLFAGNLAYYVLASNVTAVLEGGVA